MWRKICQVVDSHMYGSGNIDVLARWAIPAPYLKEILYIPCHDLKAKKPASLNHSLVSLKRYFGWLTETGRIKRDPSEGGEVR